MGSPWEGAELFTSGFYEMVIRDRDWESTAERRRRQERNEEAHAERERAARSEREARERAQEEERRRRTEEVKAFRRKELKAFAKAHNLELDINNLGNLSVSFAELRGELSEAIAWKFASEHEELASLQARLSALQTLSKRIGRMVKLDVGR